jgi:hypothetical protein
MSAAPETSNAYASVLNVLYYVLRNSHYETPPYFSNKFIIDHNLYFVKVDIP